MSGKTWFNRARCSGRVRDVVFTYHEGDRLLKGLVEVTVWVTYLYTWRDEHGRPRCHVRIGPQRRRFEFESLLLTAGDRPSIVTSFFFIGKRAVSPRGAELSRIPGAWWTEPLMRCHWASWDGEDRQAALLDAFASLAGVLRHRSPWVLEDEHRWACGSEEREFAPAEKAALIELLSQLDHLPATPGRDGGLRHRWTGDAGEAYGHQDDDRRPEDTWVNAELHPQCRLTSVSGREADELFGLGQPTRSVSFAVGAWLGATEHLLRHSG